MVALVGFGRHCFHVEYRDHGRHLATRYGAALDCHLPSPFRKQFQARVYSEDGEIRPISAVLEIPRGPSTVAVRNIGQVPTEGRDWREAERVCCARPRGESASLRWGPLSGADGIPDGRVGDGRVRGGAVW